MCKGDRVRGDKVTSKTRSQRPYVMETYAGRSELSTDAKKSDPIAHQAKSSRR